VSLSDALLLEPYPLDVWIAARTDGIKGSGTESDPYNGCRISTPETSVSKIESVANYPDYGAENSDHHHHVIRLPIEPAGTTPMTPLEHFDFTLGGS
jgi:hypothetical protein